MSFRGCRKRDQDLEERAEHATRLEAELRETRSALAKAGDVQKQLANLEERLAAAGVTPKGKK